MSRVTTTRTLAVVLVLSLATVAAACAPETPATTSTTSTTSTLPPTTRQQESIRRAADWLLMQFDSAGGRPDVQDPATYDAGNAVLAIAHLEALDLGGPGAAARLDAFLDRAEAYIDEGAGDRAGALARVILLAVAADLDPRDVRGSDLVARLEATQQPSGLFGAHHAGFDGAFRQGLALAALSLAAPSSPTIAPAVAWLKAQQCPDGAWMMFRASTVGPCVEQPAMRSFKDSNGSALAVLGLSAVGAEAAVDPAQWFHSVRGDDGGWGAAPSGAAQVSDADSTGLVIAALESLGETIPSSAWDALLAFQLGDAAAAADRGAYRWKLAGAGGLAGPNRLATLDAMAELFDEVWPAALAG